MRLHSLDVAAFGPYAGQESVDFDSLGADGLFLLHGDTGAGKTTLLDAVAFALFGAVPGARGEVKRLRCDYAGRDTPTEVRLELTVQGHRLRLSRSPEYERPKRGRTGFTTQKAKASLAWVGVPPSGQPVEGLTRIDDVNGTMQRLLGMTAAQFFQVVLLPQGEFARFLRAETTEREKLLERLFGTERFAAVERWFQDTRRDRTRAITAQRQDVRDLVTRVSQAAGEEPSDDQQADPEWLTALRSRLAQATADAQAREELAKQESDRAEAEYVAQRERAERVRRVRTASDTLATLTADQHRRDGWARELAEARRCVPVLAAARAVERVRREHTEAEQATEAAVSAVRELAGVDHPDGDVPQLRERAVDLHEQAGKLSGLVVEAEQQQADTARLTELAEAEQQAAETSQRFADRLASLPELLGVARAELDESGQATARIDGLRVKVAELAEAAEDAGRVSTALAATELAHAQLTRAVDRHQVVRERLLDIRQRRLAGMAAELAGGLAAGQPCPVCGSAAHPAPATRVFDQVGEADEQSATQVEQQAQQHRERAAKAAQDADHRLVVLRERVAGRSVEELSLALSDARAELKQSVELAALRAKHAERVRALEVEAEDLRTRRAETERNRATVAAERQSLARLVDDRAERLEAARGEHADVLARRRYLVTLAEALDALAEARASEQGVSQRHADLRVALAQAAEDAGFAGPEQALAAAREPAAVADLEAWLAEADRQSAAARAVLAEPELAGIEPTAVVDLDIPRQRLAQARSAAETAHASVRAATRRQEDVAALAGRLAEAWDRLAPAEADYAELVGLTEVVNGQGQNARRMSLRSYVLAARLEEVAVAATRRLAQMSQGRYSFVHSDAAGPRNTRGGLGLDVLDDYSGQVRPAKTLSGGESFLASLSLALGLADVVAAETGGALLDTLFVDEGFGTLDAETLDLVMDTLDELRAGGRVVGLVSHVEELRQRIPMRLRVRKARTGSTIELATR